MTQPMLASMTEGQAEDLVNKFRDAVRKHLKEIPQDGARLALHSDIIGMQLLARFCELADVTSSPFVRLVINIDRSRSPERVLIDTGRKVYADPEVVETMPRGEKSTEWLRIFTAEGPKSEKCVLSAAQIAEAYRRCEHRADVEALADYLKQNPAAADTNWIACQWVDNNNGYCYAVFDRWFDERRVRVGRCKHGWKDSWLFAGVPQESSALVA